MVYIYIGRWIDRYIMWHALYLVKASEALVEVSGDILWMGNSAPKIGGAVYLTSHAQLRLHPSANLTFVSNIGR